MYHISMCEKPREIYLLTDLTGDVRLKTTGEDLINDTITVMNRLTCISTSIIYTQTDIQR